MTPRSLVHRAIYCTIQTTPSLQTRLQQLRLLFCTNEAVPKFIVHIGAVMLLVGRQEWHMTYENRLQTSTGSLLGQTHIV